jgi:hypothetical protein
MAIVAVTAAMAINSLRDTEFMEVSSFLGYRLRDGPACAYGV